MESYEWKKDLHEEYGTKLISTYSWQFQDNSILTHLTDILEDESVNMKRRSKEEILDDLKTNYKVPLYKFTELISTYISLS